MILKTPIVLLANGDFPEHTIPLKILKRAKSIICLDGAVNKLINNNLKPTIIIGDLDSINVKFKEEYSDIIIEVSDQNQNDLRKALNWLNEKKSSDITILGATGLREDHTIGNIFSILDLELNFEIKMITDFGIFKLINKESTIKSFKGQPVSLFTSNKKTKITTSGLTYDLNKTSTTNLYSMTLNESTSDKFTISPEYGSILIYVAHS